VTAGSYIPLHTEELWKAGAELNTAAIRFAPRSITPQDDWTLVFDCETRTTPDQNLRFGAYQFRYRGHLIEWGVFYDPTLSVHEREILQTEIDQQQPTSDGERIRLLTRDEFVEHVLFEKGLMIGAQIVGFNLPFDLSRLAIGHVNARGDNKGGFSFILSNDEKWPTVTVKHLSQRASFIGFTGTRGKNKTDQDEDQFNQDANRHPDRGYFVDVKTLAGALISESHSLESLSKLLKVKTPKEPSEEHGKELKPEYVRYGMRDVQTTWECFDVLSRRFNALGLTGTGPYDLYSEASLGKAYLKSMGVKPWQDVQPGFSAEILGQIMSAYYGGRSEVHIRRQIADIIHCDFLSMYPTVCTLMGLWNFVRAKGIDYDDDTNKIRDFVESCTPDSLRQQKIWRDLTAIVQVLPDRDIFPVRAHYGDCLDSTPESDSEAATIGLNYLSTDTDTPMWFTLADVLASKVLTGKAPKIVRAVRFRALAAQEGLHAITIAGKEVNPETDDFYRALIDHRREVRAKQKTAPEEEKAQLNSDQLGIKILANATSYGIFVELNVKESDKSSDMVIHGVRNHTSEFSSKKFEKPGRYFHPLLATLITGGARLMLALAERQVLNQGLDWAFCDTDSIAIANAAMLPPDEFKRRALAARDWFTDLNPYAEKGSILRLEQVDFPADHEDDLDHLEPPQCLAISAKRYVLFNHDDTGKPIIRKASGHGLGHLMEPYGESDDLRRERIKRIGVPLWEEDFWREIIRAAESGNLDTVTFDTFSNFDVPAASRYAATTTSLLDWFKAYNAGKPYADQVKPFNFLLFLQAKSRLEMAAADMTALRGPMWRNRIPKPVAPYFKNPMKTGEHAFDRDRPNVQIPVSWLKTHGRSLLNYHLHSESKFLNGEDEKRGKLSRRHIFALAFQLIGKEADNFEERESIGDEEDDITKYPLAGNDRSKPRAFVLNMQKKFGTSDRDLCKRAHVSPHTIRVLHAGQRISDRSLSKLVSTISRMQHEIDRRAAENKEWMHRIQQKWEELGSDAALAAFLGISRSQATRLRRGQQVISDSVRRKFEK